MTNAEIILGEQIRLADEGIIKILGWDTFTTDEGEEVEIPKFQPIHTYQAWKKLGYQVKKGEKAVAKFPVWKYLTKKKKAEDDEADEDKTKVGNGRCYMKVSAFFTDEQVEPIKEDK